MPEKNEGVEIRVARGYQIFSAALFLSMGICVGGGFMLAPIFPEWIGAANDIAKGSVLTKVMVFIGGLGILLLFLYPLWIALFFRVCADAMGLRFSNGFRTQSANWDEVKSYAFESNLRWYQARNYYEELVLRDVNGCALFRLPAELLTDNRAPYLNGRNLWDFVRVKLVEKREEGV